MKRFVKEEKRDILEHFAAEIRAKKTSGPKPDTAVIFFRNEHEINFERNVVQVPISLLRFRKNNGRITSDVISYEKDKGTLLEGDPEAQKLLRKFLVEKDPEKTEELVQSIRKVGQLYPAIITADGFLINGNRRKVALELLHEETKDSKWEWMKVVILPGEKEEGDAPTLREIEQIENRYQLQSEGKSEYTLFDRALSIRRKIQRGVGLEEQLKDDPKYAYLEDREFKEKVKEFEQEFLDPIKVIDRYLLFLDRKNLYSTITTGPGDREGRWQAFLDYSETNRLLKDPNYRKKYNLKINESEIGDVEEVAFKIIRKRSFPKVDKVHQIMRNLRKYLRHEESKEELMELLDIDFTLPDEDIYDENGNEYDEREKDRVWGQKHATPIIRQVKVAKALYEQRNDKDTPIKLLETALKKLNHEDMKPDLVPKEDLNKARKLSIRIEERGEELRKEFFSLSKK